MLAQIANIPDDLAMQTADQLRPGTKVEMTYLVEKQWVSVRGQLVNQRYTFKYASADSSVLSQSGEYSVVDQRANWRLELRDALNKGGKHNGDPQYMILVTKYRDTTSNQWMSPVTPFAVFARPHEFELMKE